MILSDLSIKRPVVCVVASIFIVLVGTLMFLRLPVREYPNTDSPIVSVGASYAGASAGVMEAKVTEPLEKEISSIDGIRTLRSWSSEQSSFIAIEFVPSKNIDEAANDVRDRVSRARSRLPRNITEPIVTKDDSDSPPIITMSFYSDRYSRLELTEMVDRLAVQRIQTIAGVGGVSLRGPRYAMRLWVNPDQLAAYNLTVTDVASALQQQNINVPSGRIESLSREFPVQLEGTISSPMEFENLVLATREGYQVKFGDIGRVELGAADYRNDAFFKGRSTVSVQVQRQSQSNLLDVAKQVKLFLPLIQRDLPEGVFVEVSYDTSVFVERSIREVYHTLFQAAALVILMIFLFLRDWRATVIPLLAIPISIVGTFAVMNWLGFTLNVFTLLALVLAVGLVVDDAIVVLENIYRRMEAGEPVIRAAIFGSRQVGFAVIATTLTLAGVFVPVAFQSGQIGRLFYEFGLTLTIAVLVSAFVALTLTPMLCSRLLRIKISEGKRQHNRLYELTEPFFVWFNRRYSQMLHLALRHKGWVLLGVALFTAAGFYSYTRLQRELAPLEDRGIFSARFISPVGSTPAYNIAYSREMEQIILDIPEVDRTYHRAGEGRGFVFVTLKSWEERIRTTQQIIGELRRKFHRAITGGQATVSPARPLGGGGDGIEIVLQGSDFGKLQEVGKKFIERMRGSPIFSQPRLDPSPTKPQLVVRIDRARAADLSVSISDIGASLETLLGGRRVTEFQRGSRQYDVIVQVQAADRATPSDLTRLYVKSRTGLLVQLSNLVSYSENLVPESYPHFNRLRSSTVSSQVNLGYTMSDGVEFLAREAKTLLPEGYSYSWDGGARDFLEGTNDTLLIFGYALIFTFLILAAQFESWIHPVTIFTGVAIAVAGGLMVLYCARWWRPAMTDNLFSRFGLIMLIGLVAKNGILIVEFANQLQLQGKNAFDAAFEASTVRFRPILMTAIATILGAVPLAIASGAGAETRNAMGIVVVGGLAISTFLTLFVVPIFYLLMDRLSIGLTGKSSAHGLLKAQEIAKDVATEALPAK
ncbi:MAG: efflux RND transporter permease subunit [Opitutaceae bacterium]|nr:efflux RND transporter permease subunit [Opitutaceae bacterium]